MTNPYDYDDGQAFMDEDIWQAILDERERQMKVVGWSWENDAKNTVNDWAALIAQYATSATHYSKGGDEKAQRDALVKAGALVLAALEADAMNGGFPLRHYDND